MTAKPHKAPTEVGEVELDPASGSGRILPLWTAGPGGMFARERVIAIGRWDSAPIRRAAQQARKQGRLIDLTFGYACKSVIFMDNGHLVLSASLHFWPEPVPFEPTADDDRLSPRGDAR